MNQLISDQAQRLQALDPSSSFIVQAPAGSGKTELLIQRFLVLLARVDFPESVLAITFTRKAASEMRQRIIQALHGATGEQPKASHAKHTWTLAREALARNDQLQWHLLDNPLRLRIQTIDSLCSLLVRRMPWISRMGAILEPEENAYRLYGKAARQTLEALYSSQKMEVIQPITILLSHLDNQMGRLEILLSAMLSNRDQWIRHVMGRGVDLEETRRILESSLKKVIQDTLDQMVSLFPEEHIEETTKLARFAANHLKNSGRDNHLEACLKLERWPGSSAEDLNIWTALAELLLTRSGTRRTRYTVREGFPGEEREAKERIKKIHLEPEVAAQLHGLRQLPPMHYEEEQWNVLSALIHLLPSAVRQLRRVFQQEGSVDFTEIAMAAQEAIQTHRSSDARAPLPDMNIRHLLVDEFQDTSQSQYELLKGLIHDWVGDGRTLFLVGDPMQSIYGFREAEVSLFARTCALGLGAVRLQPLVLETNFRSGIEIVNWINEALGDAFPKDEDPVTGGVAYRPSKAFRTDLVDCSVQLHPFFLKDSEVQSERVVDIIRETLSEQPGSTIAVLVQARNHLVDIIALLRRHEIPFRSVDIDPLHERPAVRDLLALTQALLHPGNRVAWLSILRAPWCGLTLADLQTLVGDDFRSVIEDLIRDRKELLSGDGRRRLERIVPTLEHASTLRGRLPVRRWVEGVWLALGGPACLRTRAELDDASAYLDLLEASQEGADLRDEVNFMDAVKRLFAPTDTDASDALQLLTIHRAKGLEFDTVILPGLGYRTRGDASRLLMWREYNDGQHSNLLLAPIREAGGKQDAVYQYLQTIENRRRDHESTRLLYVAATRARKNLHLVGHVTQGEGPDGFNGPDSRSLLFKMWKAAKLEFLEAWKDSQISDTEHEVAAQNQAIGVPLIRLSNEWSSVDPVEELIWEGKREQSEDEKEERGLVFEWVGDLQRRVGIVVHRMLQQMRFPDRVEFKDHVLRAALHYEGLEGENLENALVKVKMALENTLEDQRGRWVLSKHEEDQWEYAITAQVGVGVRRFILDRTFVESGVRWIVDYKTSTHGGSDVDVFLDNEKKRYESKMQEYAQAIRAIDSHPIYLGLYFPMLKGWRQWEFIE